MKFRIVLRSFDSYFIQQATEQIRSSLLETESLLKGTVALPTRIKRFCVLRSPHVDKDSREHFELRIYKRFIDIEINSPEILDKLFKTELPSGISCSLKILAN